MFSETYIVFLKDLAINSFEACHSTLLKFHWFANYWLSVWFNQIWFFHSGGFANPPLWKNGF